MTRTIPNFGIWVKLPRMIVRVRLLPHRFKLNPKTDKSKTSRRMAKLISQPNAWIPYTGRPVVTGVPIITVNTGRHWRLRGITWSVWRLDRPPCTLVVIVPLTI